MASQPGAAWDDRDIIRMTVTSGLGLAAIVGAWFGASGTTAVGRQAIWLEVATVGFAVSAAGWSLWLLRGRRAIGEKKAALIALTPTETEEPSTPRRSPRPAATMPLDLVRAPGMARVHHPECPLVAGKTVEPAAPGDGEPCQVCAP